MFFRKKNFGDTGAPDFSKRDHFQEKKAFGDTGAPYFSNRVFSGKKTTFWTQEHHISKKEHKIYQKGIFSGKKTLGTQEHHTS